MEDARTIRVRCTSWDQVESFYSEKVTSGNGLVVRMPFRPAMGEVVTVALGLPDGLVFAIDGAVTRIGMPSGDKYPVALRLHGFTNDVRVQLSRLVEESREADGTADAAPSPVQVPVPAPEAEPEPDPVPEPPSPRAPPDEVADDERAVYQVLAEEHARLLGLPAHHVLGVGAEADARDIRVGFLAQARQRHPDRYLRYRSPGIRRLATEVFLHVRRAHACLQGAAGPPGWLIAIEPAPVDDDSAGESDSYEVMEIVQAEVSAPVVTAAAGDGVPMAIDSPTESGKMRALTAEELFGDVQIPAAADMGAIRSSGPVTLPPALTAGRAALAAGRFPEAREHFAAALRAEPKNRTLRALYHVATGMELRARGEGASAQLQFETALAHDKGCEEARRALAQVSRGTSRHR